MSDAAPSADTPESYPRAADVDDVLAEFGGDPRAAIAALLRDLDTLARDYEGAVSRGFTRRAVARAPLAHRLRR